MYESLVEKLTEPYGCRVSRGRVAEARVEVPGKASLLTESLDCSCKKIMEKNREIDSYKCEATSKKREIVRLQRDLDHERAKRNRLI